MSDCGCENNGKRIVLLYSCSGGANVAEAADRAAREVMLAGGPTMFCLAGLGADIQGMIQTARDADLNVVIDGCDVDCGKKVFDNRGLSNYVHIKVTDLDIDKVTGVGATEEQVAVVVKKITETLAGGCCGGQPCGNGGGKAQ